MRERQAFRNALQLLSDNSDQSKHKIQSKNRYEQQQDQTGAVRPARERAGAAHRDDTLEPRGKGPLQVPCLRDAACGRHARSGPAGRELRASAAGRLRPARPLARSILLATSPQPPIFAEIFCSNLDCAAVGSPQPPPGGGLLPRAAQKHARPLGCGLVLRQGQPL